MTDKHLRRLGQDYGDAFLELLPKGQAWPKNPGSTLDLASRGLVEYWGYVDGDAADLLERESDPRATTPPQPPYQPSGLLPDWERNWGLPDPCYDAPTGINERQRALIDRMTMIGAQSREWFIWFADYIGYTITITEYRTFVVGMDRVGDARVKGDGSVPMYNEWGNPWYNPHGDLLALDELSEFPYYGLGPPENRYYWTVHVEDPKLVWFRVSDGIVGVDPHLRIETFDELECVLNRWKPAHTEIIFDYSGVSEQPTLTLSANIVAENAPRGTVVGIFDVEGPYRGVPGFFLADSSNGMFEIHDGNKLVVAGDVDYETATEHDIVVMPGNIEPIIGYVPFTILVTDVDDLLPVITSPSTVNNLENTVLSLSLTSNKPVVWSIFGGADAAKFELVGTTLRWYEDATKNFEAPDDSNADRAYVITIRATDAVLHTVDQTITVTVTDVAEMRGIMTAFGPGGIVLVQPILNVPRDANAGGVMFNL